MITITKLALLGAKKIKNWRAFLKLLFSFYRSRRSFKMPFACTTPARWGRCSRTKI